MCYGTNEDGRIGPVFFTASQSEYTGIRIFRLHLHEIPELETCLRYMKLSGQRET